MHNDDGYGDTARERRRTRLRSAGLLAAALSCLAVLAAACSSGPAGSGAVGTGGSTGGSARASGLAFSQCMRAHGIKNFPDPTGQGGISLPNGLNPNSPQFQAANTACRSLLPHHTFTPGQAAKMKAQNLKYAECMRAHGISDFPDPNSQGQLQIQAKPGSDLDPNNPRFQAANRACQQYQPGGGKGGSLNSSGGGGGGA